MACSLRSSHARTRHPTSIARFVLSRVDHRVWTVYGPFPGIPDPRHRRQLGVENQHGIRGGRGPHAVLEFRHGVLRVPNRPRIRLTVRYPLGRCLDSSRSRHRCPSDDQRGGNARVSSGGIAYGPTGAAAIGGISCPMPKSFRCREPRVAVTPGLQSNPCCGNLRSQTCVVGRRVRHSRSTHV